MSQKVDVVVELSKLTVRALKVLGHVGVEEREHACELAGQAWALLHEQYPEAAERMNGVLHFLTGPRFNPPKEGAESRDDLSALDSASPADSEPTTIGERTAGHPWLPAPEPLKTEEEVAAYFREVVEKAAGRKDFDLEVRHLIPADRHTLIIDAFNKLSPKQGFILINDHDPKPLYYQFAFEYADRFTWDPLEEGPEVWRVRIGRR